MKISILIGREKVVFNGILFIFTILVFAMFSYSARGISIIPRLSVVLKPWVAFIPYSSISYNHVSTNQNYLVSLVNLGAGVEFCL